MNEDVITLYNSKAQYIRLALLASIFVGTGVFIILNDPTPKSLWIGGLSIVFFGFGIVVAIKQLLNTKPRITITETGIVDHSLNIGEIEWRDILEANLLRIQREHFISLVLRDEQKYIDRLSGTGKKFASANQAIGFEKLNINLSGVKCDTREILNLIRQRASFAR